MEAQASPAEEWFESEAAAMEAGIRIRRKKLTRGYHTARPHDAHDGGKPT